MTTFYQHSYVVLCEFRTNHEWIPIGNRWQGRAGASEMRPKTKRDQREAKAKLMWAAGGFAAGALAAFVVLKASGRK